MALISYYKYRDLRKLNVYAVQVSINCQTSNCNTKFGKRTLKKRTKATMLGNFVKSSNAIHLQHICMQLQSRRRDLYDKVVA